MFSAAISNFKIGKKKETSYGAIFYNSSLSCISLPKRYKENNSDRERIYFQRSRTYNKYHGLVFKEAIMLFLDKIEKEIVNVYFKGYNPYINSPKFLSNIYVKLVTLRDKGSVKGITESILYYNLGAIKSKSNFSRGDISSKPFFLPSQSI